MAHAGTFRQHIRESVQKKIFRRSGIVLGSKNEEHDYGDSLKTTIEMFLLTGTIHKVGTNSKMNQETT